MSFGLIAKHRLTKSCRANEYMALESGTIGLGRNTADEKAMVRI
jgi:hypothetical protein